MRTYPSKHAGSDPETFCLQPVMAITASVQPESGRIMYALSNCPNQIQFRFSKEGMNHNVQNGPGSVMVSWSRFWSNASGLEASRCAGIFWPSFWQDATSPLPISHFQTRFFHRRPGSAPAPQTSPTLCKTSPTLCKTSPDSIWFWLTVSGFSQTDPSGNKSVCKDPMACFWPRLPSRSGSDANRIRHVYWVVTWVLTGSYLPRSLNNGRMMQKTNYS